VFSVFNVYFIKKPKLKKTQSVCVRGRSGWRMKTVDISAYTIIKEGVEICVQRTPADSAQSAPIDGLLPTMERNEGAVFWLQPKNGTVEQQEACICVNGTFYMLNSKFEKAIFRSVRLTRDFQNYERLVDGTRKLVIPRRLFHEKLRTSRRVSFAVYLGNSMYQARATRSA
jgi:hypothetical protein